MWRTIEGWFPGLRHILEDSGLGIVETPEDMQGECDDGRNVPAVVPAGPPPSRPGQAYVPEVGKPPETGPRMTPTPNPTGASVGGDELLAAEAEAQAFAGRVPASRDLPPLDLLEGLRTANGQRRRERRQAMAERDGFARLLAAERAAHTRALQLHADLKHAGIAVAVLVDAAGTRVLRLRIPERDGRSELLFELPPIRTNPLYDLDGSTTDGGRPSGPIAPADGCAGPLRLGAADRTGEAAREH